jgi:hypothetical protein
MLRHIDNDRHSNISYDNGGENGGGANYNGGRLMALNLSNTISQDQWNS